MIQRLLEIFHSKKILFLIHFPTDEDLKDGYFQRVAAIDGILHNYMRFYVRYESRTASFRDFNFLHKINSNTFELHLNKNNPMTPIILLSLSFFVGNVYLHTILRLSSRFHRILFKMSRNSILDVHGVVPEEFIFDGDKRGGEVFNNIERFAISKADVVLAVTFAMKAHLVEKYPNLAIDGKTIILPIFPAAENSQCKLKKIDKKRKTVIYCGGIQKWQQIDLMMDFVHKASADVNFYFLVPCPKVVKDLYFNKFKKDFPGHVRSVASHEVVKWYKKAHFGLVLRENIIVNRVACPTKLVEYLQNDIIPIVDYIEIGDFNALGYKYISYKDCNLKFIDYDNFITNNRNVIKDISLISIEGAASLRKVIN